MGSAAGPGKFPGIAVVAFDQVLQRGFADGIIDEPGRPVAEDGVKTSLKPTAEVGDRFGAALIGDVFRLGPGDVPLGFHDH